MSDDYSKLWIQRNLNQLATNRALEAIKGTGRALPCKVTEVAGSIVTVTFEIKGTQTPAGTTATFEGWTLPPLTLPKAESQWLRAPTQKGDLGMTMPADTFLGGVSGLGTGVADPTVDYGNMTTLVFVPVAAVGFGPAPDPNRAWINGPNGFDATDTARTGGIFYDAATATVTIYAGAQTIVVTSDPSITSTVTGVAGNLQTIVDGAGNATSTVVPLGGKVGIGSLASELDPTRAAYALSDVTSFENNLWSKRLDDLTKFATAMVAAGVPNAGAVLGLLATLLHVPIPAGSATVFLKP